MVACAERVSIRVVTHTEIDRAGLHASNLAVCARSHALAPPAEICLVDGFRLGKKAPEHLAVVGGDGRARRIAAASIVAKVVRDRVMRRLDALLSTVRVLVHVGYITPGHSARVREHGGRPPSTGCPSPPSAIGTPTRRSTRAAGGERSGAPSSIPPCAATACSAGTSGPVDTRSISSCDEAAGSSLRGEEQGVTATAIRWRWSAVRSSVGWKKRRSRGSRSVPSWTRWSCRSRSLPRAAGGSNAYLWRCDPPCSRLPIRVAEGTIPQRGALVRTAARPGCIGLREREKPSAVHILYAQSKGAPQK